MVLAGERLVGLFKRVILGLGTRKIHQHQFQIVLGIRGELVRFQYFMVKLDAPRTPIGTGKVEQYHFAVRPGLRQRPGKISAPIQVRRVGDG